jgi:uncharacterized protein YjbJ (UPF0337 family)
LDTSEEKVRINWSNLKPKIKKHWRKLTEEDLNQSNGNVGDLVNVLRRRYGYGKIQAEIEINKWLGEQDNEPM